MTSNASSGMISVDSASLKADIEAYLAKAYPVNELLAEESAETISFLLEDVFDRFKPFDMTSEEGSCVKRLLRRIFSSNLISVRVLLTCSRIHGSLVLKVSS